MADVRASQLGVIATLSQAGEPSPESRVSQVGVLAAAAFPADFVNSSQLGVSAVVTADMTVRASQLGVVVAAAGRQYDPTVRCFTFTLDGHDFYVVKLGMRETIVFDTHTQQFYVWGSRDTNLWKAYDGVNWIGAGPQQAVYGSNIVVGDDSNGAIYFLDPEASQDDDSLQGSALKRDFVRKVSGQALTKGYSSIRCFGVELLGSIGQLEGGTTPTVTLSYSDDRGQTYVDASPITLTEDDFDARVFWRSLGSMRSPGRIFKITDHGALKRIDSLTMIAEGEGKT